ncbi:MAG: hypothetical protein IKO53_00975 [Lachnospiraceae bacterium]|nr:hypothetical protein [Lachnospiraceae bacterium]
MRKRRGRLFGALMSAVLLTAEVVSVSGIAFGTKPMTAQADDGEPEIQLGTAGIGKDEFIAYGKKAEATAWGTTIYRVLDADTDNAGTTGAMFVLSEGLWGTGGNYGNVYFDNTASYSNVWQDSDAKGWCGDFYTANFGTVEKTAVKAITKDDAAEEVFGISWAASSLNGENVFFLSAKEVSTYISATAGDALKAKYGEDPGNWWLRSPCADGTDSAGLVNDGGHVSIPYVSDDYAARPAFNINLQSVIFSSASGASKSSYTDPREIEKSNAIGTKTNPWKLTLLDGNMTVTPGVSSGFADNDHKILLNDCTSTGDSDRVSVMITDKEWAEGNANGASMLYYGKLGEDKTFIIPDALDIDDWGTEYHIYLIAEKTGTGYASDYASMPTEVTAIGETPVEPAKPSNSNSSSSSSSKSHKAHVHEYEWVTISEPTPYADGEYAYKCKGCGHIADTATGDYTAALMTAMTAAIKAAPENGTVKMDCGYYVSLNSVVAAAHDARPDVTTIFTFIYRGDTYELTIPAGVALVPSLNEEGWAGFMHIRNIEGVTIVKK